VSEYEACGLIDSDNDEMRKDERVRSPRSCGSKMIDILVVVYGIFGYAASLWKKRYGFAS
jgi:hypothetical protein